MDMLENAIEMQSPEEGDNDKNEAHFKVASRIKTMKIHVLQQHLLLETQ